MKNIKIHWKRSVFLLYALIIVLTFIFFHSYTQIEMDKMYIAPGFERQTDWEVYTLQDGIKTNMTLQEVLDSAGKTVYFSKIMDTKWQLDGYTILELDGRNWQESVFLDEKLLYTVNTNIENQIGSVEFPAEYTGVEGNGEYVRLTLPPEYGGKRLTIAFAMNEAVEYPSLPMIRLSSEAILTQSYVSGANQIAMPATMYMTLAMLLLGLFFYNWYQGYRSTAILLLMFAACIQALRWLLNFEFYFSSPFSLNFIPAELLVPLSLAMPILYFMTLMKQWKKYFAPFIVLPLLLSISFHMLARFPQYAILSAYSYDALFYLSLLALGVFSILEWKDKNQVYRLFTPLFMTIVSCLLVIILTAKVVGYEQMQWIYVLSSPFDMVNEGLQYYGDIVLLLGIAISFIMTIKSATDREYAFSVMTMKNEMIRENMIHMQESMKEIASMRHDMLRHLHTALDLHQTGDTERLKNYLLELTKETETILPMKICKHPTINALLSRAFIKAKPLHIKLDLHVEVPEHLSIGDNDLCTLIMNMLDNAIDAVSLLPLEKERKIEVTMHVRGRYLFIETINTYEGHVTKDSKTGLLISTKGKRHGYGMKAMANVASKYNSKLQVLIEDTTLTVRTALLIPETNDKNSC